eukprot:gene4424-5635_t
MGVDNNRPGYSELTRMAGKTTYDAVVLEFDFVPISDKVEFKYVFASEEYLEYVNRGFNDVFGFFLSGSGITGTVNLAVLPETDEIVSVNSINDRKNAQYFIDNGSTLDPHDKVGAYRSKIYDNQLQWDGFTTVLTASHKVQPYQKYHIKLAIADVIDQALDSGVFIEGGSFSSTGSMQVATDVNFGPNDSTLVENCNAGTVTLIRTDAAAAQNIQVIYTGTAAAASDFGGLPPVMHFNAGEDSVQINLQALADAAAEGTEDLYVGFIVPSACGN